MALLRCMVSEGLRKAEASVTVREYDDTPQHFPLDRGMVSRVGDHDAIPVVVLQFNREGDLALVSLPVEADSGDYRIWVRVGDMTRVP